jgi:F-type H+-transporting ATPase subunit a
LLRADTTRLPYLCATLKELAVSAEQMLAFETDCHIFDGCGFNEVAPGLHSFVFQPLFTVGGYDFNKPMLLALVATVVIVGFFWAAFNKPKVVPGKLQMVAEAGYDLSAAASSTRRSASRRATSTSL